MAGLREALVSEGVRLPARHLPKLQLYNALATPPVVRGHSLVVRGWAKGEWPNTPYDFHLSYFRNRVARKNRSGES